MVARHIALVIADFEPGGAQRVAAMLSNSWVRAGHRVSVITYQAAADPAFFEFENGVEIVHLGILDKSPSKFHGAAANLKRVRRIRSVLSKLCPDVVLGFAAETTSLVYLAAAGLRIPVIACERTDPAVHPTGMWKALRDLCYPRCARIVCQSPRAAEYFKATGKAIVIPNPVTPPQTDGKPDIEIPKRPFIATLGRMSREKGHDILISAFARIARQFPDVDLLIIGDGPQRFALELQIDALGLTGRVHLSGASKAPFPVLAKAKLFVLPSRFEGFPNALCEAMALGLPCLAFEAAALAVIRDGVDGVLADSGSEADLAAKMEALLRDPDRCADLAREAARIKDTLSLENILKKWDEALAV